MIKRIRIRDFKSIRELDLELDPVTVLVGRSGTGKSNLVQAIRFLRNYLLNPQEAVNYEFGWARIIPVGESEPKTLIEVTFSVPSEERDYNYQICFQKRPGHGDPSLQAESLRLGNECLFSREILQDKQFSVYGQGRHWRWQTPPKVTPQPGFTDTPMLGSFPSLQQVVFAYAALSAGIGYYHLPSTVLGIVRGQEHGEQFLKTIRGLSDNASNYREVMRSITQDFRRANIRKSLLASLQAVNPGISSIELDSLTNPQRAIIAHKTGDRVFELSLEQESDGLRRFYAHLLALYQN